MTVQEVFEKHGELAALWNLAEAMEYLGNRVEGLEQGVALCMVAAEIKEGLTPPDSYYESLSQQQEGGA